MGRGRELADHCSRRGDRCGCRRAPGRTRHRSGSDHYWLPRPSGSACAAFAAWIADRVSRAATVSAVGTVDTERQQANADRGLLSELPLALVLLDRDGRTQLMNAAATDLFGHVATAEPLSSLSRAPALANAVSSVAVGGPATTVEFVHMRTREQRVLLDHVRPLEAAGQHHGAEIMLPIEDHTRSAKAEQVRRDFVANASHELKTPLASITGFIETLQGRPLTTRAPAPVFSRSWPSRPIGCAG